MIELLCCPHPQEPLDTYVLFLYQKTSLSLGVRWGVIIIPVAAVSVIVSTFENLL
jgi:hypothetical protein